MPKVLTNLGDIDQSSTTRKRLPSSDENLINARLNTDHRPRLQAVSENNLEFIEVENGDSTNIGDENLAKSPNEAMILSMLSLKEAEKENFVEKSCSELYNLASVGLFPEKLFLFANVKKMYSTRLHFFDSDRTFAQRPSNHVKFHCKICPADSNPHLAIFPHFQNLNAHLKIHEQFRLKWLHFYNLKFPHKKNATLDSETYDLL
jgi:hypothetical protein